MSAALRPSLRAVAACAAALALAAGLPACLVVDTRDPLRIEGDGALTGSDTVALRVSGPAGARFELIADGVPRPGTWAANVPVTVPLAGLAEGEHELVARELDRARPAVSAARTLLVDRTGPSIELRPEPGEQLLAPGFTVEAVLSEPAREAFVDAESGGRLVAHEMALSEDGRTVRVVLPAPPPDVTVTLAVNDALGNPARAEARYWARRARARIALDGADAPARPVPVAGAVLVEVALEPDPSNLTPLVLPPGGAQLLANGVPVAALSGPAPWSVRWDTGSLAEGEYAITVAVPGVDVSAPDGGRVRVDRTPPSLVRCVRASHFEFGDPYDLVGAELDEPVASVEGAVNTPAFTLPLVVERMAVAARLPRFTPPLAGALTATVTDEAGNRSAPITCPFEYAAWFDPFAGRARTGEGPLVASAGALVRPTDAPPFALDLIWLEPGAAGGGARVRWAGGGRSLDATATGNLAPDAGASDLALDRRALAPVWAAWVESRPGAPRTLVARRVDRVVGTWKDDPGPLNEDPGRDAGEPSIGDGVAWIETDASGETTLHATYWPPGGARAVGTLRSSPGSRLAAPALGLAPASAALAPHAVGSALVAYVEAGADGSRALRAGAFDAEGRWVPVGDRLDGGGGVKSPSIWSDPDRALLAWIEGEQVWTRTREPAVRAWTPPAAVSPEGVVAAHVQVADDRVFYVERSGPRDRIHVLHLDRSALPPAWVEGPPPSGWIDGGVRSLFAPETALVVSWVEADGALQVRMYNGPR